MAVFLAGGVYLWASKDTIIASARSIYDNFKQLSLNIKTLDTDGADKSLASVSSELDILQGRLGFLSLIPALRAVPETFERISDLTDIIVSLNTDLALMKREGVHMLFSESGESITAVLKRTDTSLGDLEAVIADLRNRIIKVSSFADIGVPDNYLAMSSDLLEARRSLQALIAFFERHTDKHILVLLENPTEIRPAGGFFGSYAVITLQGDKVANIEVNDIYYPDHFLERKIVPPAQLQGVSADWGARDANWFFDFPTSARKVSELMEASPVFSDPRTTFDAVIGLDVWTIEDIFDIVGPIEVPEYDMTLSSENFLSEVQLEVEEGRDKVPGQNPKKVLSVIAPILLEKVSALDAADKQRLFEALSYRIENKDVKLYFEDETIEAFIKKLGAAGDVFELPKTFTGDYLAVVNTNVAGGKSDRFMTEEIELHSTVLEGGTIQDDLIVTRSHRGTSAKEWWYRSDNQNFIKIFSHPYARLVMLEGGTKKTVAPQVNYANADYETDPDLSKVEGTKVYLQEFDASRYTESGKSVFATWFTVPFGEVKELRMRYTIPQAMTIGEGRTYTFVYDKQSGVEVDLLYTIKAPAGYIWKESGESLYRYTGRNLPARVSFTLTLEAL